LDVTFSQNLTRSLFLSLQLSLVVSILTNKLLSNKIPILSFNVTPCSFDICILWGKLGSLWKHVVHKISSVEGNLFILGLVCYFCSGTPKINILTAQISKYLTSMEY
jgi:hypothetical protein